MKKLLKELIDNGKLIYKGPLQNTYISYLKDGQKIIIKEPLYNNYPAIPIKDEVTILNSLRSSDINIPKIIMELSVDGHIVYHYINGENLKVFKRTKKPLWKEIRNIFLQMLEQVYLLHAQDILHLDLKPQNIIYDGEKVTLIDFGVAKCIGSPQGIVSFSKNYALTDIKHFNSDVNRDIYSLFKILIYLITGKVFEDVKGIEEPLRSFIKKGIERDKKKQFKSIEEIFEIWDFLNL